MRLMIGFVLIAAAGLAPAQEVTTDPLQSVTGYSSIQTALDANPGKVLFVPSGDHVVSEPVRISTNGAGLWGYGRIVQSDADQPIVVVQDASEVRLEGVTLTRAAGAQESNRAGLHAVNCERLTLENVQVLDNWANTGAISLENCRGARVQGCTVHNYKRISVDDRTESDLYGYAFKVIDGTGIQATRSQGLQLLDNRVTETRLMPDKETKEKFQLGQVTEGRKPRTVGKFNHTGDYFNNWHQGSAMVVTSPMETDHVLIRGNYIENAAQGIDMHVDNATCTQNIIKYAFVGIKCMHGSKNVIISDNNISYMDLWGLVMLPGSSSLPAAAATGDQPARPANYTRGNIIANNIFSGFGFGHERWNWEKQRSGVISLESGQLPENPVMVDVLVQGNIVYDTGRDQILQDGQPVTVPPLYNWAVYISPDPRPGLLFKDNIFHPGSDGISNLPLDEGVPAVEAPAESR